MIVKAALRIMPGGFEWFSKKPHFSTLNSNFSFVIQILPPRVDKLPSLCHPKRSEGSPALKKRSFAALRMTEGGLMMTGEDPG